MKKISVVLILLGAVSLAAGLYGWFEFSQAARTSGLGSSMTYALLDWGQSLGVGDTLSVGDRITLFLTVNHSGFIWGGAAGIALGAILRAISKKEARPYASETIS